MRPAVQGVPGSDALPSLRRRVPAGSMGGCKALAYQPLLLRRPLVVDKSTPSRRVRRLPLHSAFTHIIKEKRMSENQEQKTSLQLQAEVECPTFMGEPVPMNTAEVSVRGLRRLFKAMSLHGTVEYDKIPDLAADLIESLRQSAEDLQLELEDVQGRYKTASHNASAFESRMGDLQVENGKLRDKLANSAGVGAVKLPDRTTIREIFIRNGFSIKEGQDDLKPYVYAAAQELLGLARQNPAQVPEAFVCDSKPLERRLNATAMVLETPCQDSATYWAACLADVEALLAFPVQPPQQTEQVDFKLTGEYHADVQELMIQVIQLKLDALYPLAAQKLPVSPSAWRVIDSKGKRHTVYNGELANEIAALGLHVQPMCDIPPEGWECSRDPGHDGPCAAREGGAQ